MVRSAVAEQPKVNILDVFNIDSCSVFSTFKLASHFPHQRSRYTDPVTPEVVVRIVAKLIGQLAHLPLYIYPSP